jgi:hypothetical protein
MRILFALPDDCNDASILEYTKCLIPRLRARGHRVATLPRLRVTSGPNPDVDESFESIRDADSEDWDVLLTQDIRSISAIQATTQRIASTPLIHIMHSSALRHQPIRAPNLFRCVKTAECHSLRGWGVPTEIAEVHRWPIVPEHRSYSRRPAPPFHVLTIVDNSDEMFDVARHVIKLANAMSYIDLSVVASTDCTILRDIAGGNVTFYPEASARECLLDTDLFIGSKHYAVSAMMCCKPCIVVGVAGFGGQVTPENYIEFKVRGFEGRPGGEPNELIPMSLLARETTEVLQNEDLTSRVDAVFNCARMDYDSDTVVQGIDSLLCNVVALSHSIHDNVSMLDLRPRFTSQCIIADSGRLDEHDVIHHELGLVVTSLDRDMRELLECCNGKSSIAEILHSGGGIGESDLPVLCDNLRALWDANIIVF